MMLNEVKHGCDTGLQCLKVVANTLGVAVDEGKITADYGDVIVMDTNILLKLTKRLKLKANLLKVSRSEFMTILVPAIAVMYDGRYCVISGKNSTHALVYDPSVGHPEAIPLEQFFAGWSGEIIVIKKPFGMESLLHRYNLVWFIPTIKKYKNIFKEVLLASFFLQLLGIVTPLVTQVVIDKVIVNKGDATLDVLAAALLIVALFQAMMGFLRTYLSAHTTNKLDIILGARIFHHLIMLPFRYFELRRVGDTLTRVAALNSIREFLTGSALTALMDVVFSVVFIIVMLYYSTSLTFITLLALPFFIGQNVFVTPLYRERLEEVWAAGAESNSFLVEAITGVHTIKSLAIEPQFNHKWEQLTSKYISASFQNAKFNIFNNNASSMIQKLTGFAILLFGGHKVMNGEMTVGQLIAFQMLAGQASAPIYRLTGMWQSVQQAGLSLERIGDILKVPPESVQTKKSTKLEQIKGNIVFDNIVFRYRADGREILNKVNLNITAGMKVGVVGRSGSGKSTLAKLLQRLYIPESGRILIAGHDISKLDPVWLRRQIGVVLQENYLFNGSVRQNIAFARSSASINEVIQAARMAGAHEFILELPEGYDTMVGERGTALSGGQQQRIAIARAILTNPSIIIFDEATSALDYESERIIMDNFAEIAIKRTILMIAHRLSTVKRFDLIIVLDNGKVVEQGKHDELMDRKGIYYNLYRQQEG